MNTRSHMYNNMLTAPQVLLRQLRAHQVALRFQRVAAPLVDGSRPLLNPGELCPVLREATQALMELVPLCVLPQLPGACHGGGSGGTEGGAQAADSSSSAAQAEAGAEAAAAVSCAPPQGSVAVLQQLLALRVLELLAALLSMCVLQQAKQRDSQVAAAGTAAAGKRLRLAWVFPLGRGIASR